MRSKLTRLLIPIFITIVFALGCGTDYREVRLAYKFHPGKTYTYEYKTDISSNTYEDGALTSSDKRTYRLLYDQEILEAMDHDRGRIKYTYTLKEPPAGPVNITGTDTAAASWSNECIMANDGSIVEFASDSSATPGSADYYRRLFEQASPMYPDEPVKEGFVWSHTVRVVTDDGLTDATTTYKIKSFVRSGEHDCAVIEYRGNMLIPLEKSCPDEITAIQSGMDKIEVEGVAYFAYTEGIILREEESSHLVREATIIQDGEPIELKIDEIRTYTNHLTDISQP